jgi:hypothetical protein
MRDLAAAGFVLDSHWYWDLFEDAGAPLEAPALDTMRAIVKPLARHAGDRIALAEIECDEATGALRFQLANSAVAITFDGVHTARAAVERLTHCLNDALAAADTGYLFALAVPRRYEVRGVLLARAELMSLAAFGRHPMLRLPSDLSPWLVRASRPSLA